MTSRSSEGATYEWDEPLEEFSDVTVTRGGVSTVIPFQRLIALTNGAIIEMLGLETA